jgi:hypothetical protein
MATTTNYGWTTPDDTALVKDGAAAIRTLGSSVDTTTKALNPSTTLGDIEYRSSTANTNTRLGIGSTGQILTVSGGVPAWAAAATPNIQWTAVNSGGTTLSGSTTTISGITGANQLMVLYVGASSTNTYIELYARINNDSGSNYLYGGLNQTGSTTNQISSTTANKFTIGGGSASGTAVTSGSLLITGGNSSGVKYVSNMSGQDGGSGNGAYGWGGYWNNTATITEINFFFSAGTFDAGTVYVFKSA